MSWFDITKITPDTSNKITRNSGEDISILNPVSIETNGTIKKKTNKSAVDNTTASVDEDIITFQERTYSDNGNGRKCSAITSDASVVVIGSAFNDDQGTDMGAAHIYYRNLDYTLTLIKTVYAPVANQDTSDWFGYSVAINETGDIIVVGASYDDGTGDAISGAGTVYVYYKDEGGTDNWGLKKTLYADPANDDTSDFFGASVAIDGTTIVVGAYQDDGSTNAISSAGTAYVYYKDEGGTDNWGLKKSLFGGNEDASDFFGRSVAIDGTTIVVGAYNDDGTGDLISGAGTAYVYYKDEGGTDNWGLKKSLFGKAEDVSDAFGYSVAIGGTTIVVGARYDDGSSDAVSGAGAAYVFYKDEDGTDNWGLKKSLYADGDTSGEEFGKSVGINKQGDTIISVGYANGSKPNVNIFNKDEGGTDNWGYIFKSTDSNFVNSGDGITSIGIATNNSDGSFSALVGLGSSTQFTGVTEYYIPPYSADITTTTPAAFDYFGYSIDTNFQNTIMAVGATGLDTGGSVLIYNKDGNNNWQLTKTITSPDADSFDDFGESVAVNDAGDVIVVGAKDDDGVGDLTSNAGEAYVFYKDEGGTDNWGHKATLNGANEDASDFFGAAVDINDAGDIIVVGAYNDDGTGDLTSGAGSVYVFYKDEGGTDNWGLKKTLFGPNEDTNDWFGWSVAIKDSIIVVGANEDGGSTDTITGAGSAYVFYKDEGGTDNWGLKKSLYGSKEGVGFNFGQSVAIDDTGGIIAISAKDAANKYSKGLVDVFYKDEGGTDNWGLKKTLNDGNTLLFNGTAAEGFVGNNGKKPLAVNGNIMAICDIDDGWYYQVGIYKKNINANTWEPIKNIICPDRKAFDRFGHSVAVNDAGDTMVVGAYDIAGSTGSISSAGAAYVFYKDEGGTDNWGHKATLYGANEDTFDYFGRSVAIDGTTIVVGAYQDDGTGNAISAAGTVYVFYKDEGGTDNWGLKKTLVNGPNEDASDYFGRSVAIDGTTIVVGANQDDGSTDAIAAAGSAYVFYKDEGGTDNWGLKASLYGTNEDSGDYFGYSVAIDGSTIIAGAYQDDGTGDAVDAAGAAYVFYKDEGGTDNWGLKKTLYGANEDAGDNFGESVAIDSSTIVVGASGDDGSTGTIGNAGAAYVFHKDEGGTDNWGHVKTLYSLNEDASDVFGSAVAIDGTTIAVIADNDDGPDPTNNPTKGMTYTFQKDEGGTDNWGFFQYVVKIDLLDYRLLNPENISIVNNTLATSSNENFIYLFNKDEGGTDNWGIGNSYKYVNKNSSLNTSISLGINSLTIGIPDRYINGDGAGGVNIINIDNAYFNPTPSSSIFIGVSLDSTTSGLPTDITPLYEMLYDNSGFLADKVGKILYIDKSGLITEGLTTDNNNLYDETPVGIVLSPNHLLVTDTITQI